MTANDRPSWHQYWMLHAKLAATRSTCLACQVGAVIVKGDRLIAEGYNGLPSKFPHCSETGHCIDGSENCALSPQSLAVHAEANAIGQLAKGNGGADGAVIYTTLEPCLNCLKAIVSAGIIGIFYEKPHKDNELKSLLIDRGFIYQQLEVKEFSMEVIIDGVEYVPLQPTQTDSKLLAALEIRFDSDAGDNITIRDYLHCLLKTLWQQEDCFNSKRPFGNSGWQFDLYHPLVKEGFVLGSINEYGDLDEYDRSECDAFVEKLIDAVFYGVAE